MEKRYNDLFKRYDDFNNDSKINIEWEKRKFDNNNKKIIVSNKTFDEDNVFNKNTISLNKENEKKKKQKNKVLICKKNNLTKSKTKWKFIK